jgi:hypothetical protein
MLRLAYPATTPKLRPGILTPRPELIICVEGKSKLITLTFTGETGEKRGQPADKLG